MTNRIETEHLDRVIENHSQDMSNKVVAITGTTNCDLQSFASVRCAMEKIKSRYEKAVGAFTL